MGKGIAHTKIRFPYHDHRRWSFFMSWTSKSNKKSNYLQWRTKIGVVKSLEKYVFINKVYNKKYKGE